ncbi:MAG TPA: nucleoside-diphosphate sugar epimerase/dehydratase [Chthonomonadaceae bacterium]|nr:nucleoside-diphosphate sugar epimerase/dehydratase [Chthonomonadaceae bacterium]
MSASLPGSSSGPAFASQSVPSRWNLRAAWRRSTQSGILYPKRLALCALDALCTAASLYIAFSLRLGEPALRPYWLALYLAIALPAVGLRLFSLVLLRVYRIMARYTGARDLVALALATTLGSVLLTGYRIAAHLDALPWSVVAIDWFVNFFLIAGSRMAYRLLLEARPQPVDHDRQRRILIVGAGPNGVGLAREIHRYSGGNCQLVGFVDDDPRKQNVLLDGAPVLGTTEEIRQIVTRKDVDNVIVAVTPATGPLLRELARRCEGCKVRFQIATGFAGMDGDERLQRLRDVSVEDLLSRAIHSVDNEESAAYLRGERVLVTGAGGSIGSELVRQIVLSKPAEILLLGHGENSVFEIEQELRREYEVTPTCLIADVRDYDRLMQLFQRHRPTVVFHAAAHKHVSLMEANPEEAITNNVLGSRNLVRIAAQTGVKRFVMISTDKAVNPTSVMGASKRIAEMVVQAESRRTFMECATVRFGNVLGSRGSVVPLMQKQIARGGPVTVTHPEVMRYFMTIPEAVHLVIQAGAIGGRGTIYMLDMGKPIRILDLAHNLIRLSGLVPGKDVPVKITGLKPGEKLFEELLTAEEGATVTRHERIYVAAPADFPIEQFDENLAALIAAAQRGNKQEIMRLIQVFEPGFRKYGDHAVIADAAPEPAREAEMRQAI